MHLTGMMKGSSPFFPDNNNQYVIIGGNFNLIENANLDRSSLKPLSNSAKASDTHMNRLGLLADEVFKQLLLTQMSFFFELNDAPDTCRGTLWEAFEACL